MTDRETTLQTPAYTWYEARFKDAQLSLETDGQWMSDLAGEGLDEAAIARVNDIIALGSINMNFDADPVTLQAVNRARDVFFIDTLHLDQPTNPLYSAYTIFRENTPNGIPLETFISSQRLLQTRGIDIVRVLTHRPFLFAISPQKLNDNLGLLDEFGIDVSSSVNRNPALLSYNHESLRRIWETLHASGLGRQAPFILAEPARTLKPEHLQSRISLLQSRGLDVPKIIGKQSSILNIGTVELAKRFQTLEELGLDVHKVVSAMPPILCLKPESFAAKIATLRSAGLDPIRVINTVPALIGLAPEAITRKVTLLSEHGIEPATVNAMPGLLCLAETTIINRLRVITLGLTALGSKHTAAELIELYPAVLACATNKLLATARFVAEHGDPNETPDDLRNMRRLLMEPVSLLLISAASDLPFGANSADKFRRDVPKTQRREISLALIEDPVSRSRIGEKCVQAYLRYEPVK
ncbi:hypothetical protein BH09PAT3_BH09PAT3_2990 [soil metagenome]